MNTLEHFRVTAKESGIVDGTLTTLPDIFIAGRAVPNESFKRWCYNMHNTPEAVEDMERLHPRLGRAWQRHREQDLLTHNFSYESIPDPLPEIPKGAVMLYSGGLDSFVTWRLLGQPQAVYFSIGHKAQEREIEMIEKTREQFGGNILIDDRLRLGDVEMANGYIPYRNLFFIMMASYHSQDVVMAQIAEWAPDKNKRFYKKTADLLGDITTGAFQQLEKADVRVHAPFNKYTKTELIRQYRLRGYNLEDLTKYSISCYSGNEVNCGQCNACFSRYVAMENNGVHEDYQTTPDAEKFAKKWSISDFDIRQFRMYVKRYLEMRRFL